MTLTVVATPGALDANSYLTVVACTALMASVPNADAWDTADPDSQQRAAVAATRMLDAFAYKGVRVTVPQPLQWPRLGVLDPDYGVDYIGHGYKTVNGWGVYLDYTVIPKRIERACAMLALEILRAGPADVWGVEPTVNIASKSVDVIHTTFVDPAHRRYGLRAYPSVWRELFPLTMASESRTVERA